MLISKENCIQAYIGSDVSIDSYRPEKNGDFLSFLIPTDYSNGFRYCKEFAVVNIYGVIYKHDYVGKFINYKPHTVHSKNIEILRKIDISELLSLDEFNYRLSWFKSYSKLLQEDHGIVKIKTLDHKIQLFNLSGELLNTDKFIQVDDFNFGIARVKTLDGFYNFIDLQGNLITSKKLSGANNFTRYNDRSIYARVIYNGSVMLMDILGRLIENKAELWEE